MRNLSRNSLKKKRKFQLSNVFEVVNPDSEVRRLFRA